MKRKKRNFLEDHDDQPCIADMLRYHEALEQLGATEGPVLPVITHPDDRIQNAKARRLSTVARKLVARYGLIVVDGAIYRYDTDLGCYSPVPAPERLIDELLDSNQADALTSKDCRDIVERILRLHEIQRKADAFNGNQHLINSLSGTVDVSRPDAYPEVLPHEPNQLFSYAVNAQFLHRLPEAGCPVFESFCRTSLDGDPAKRQLLLEIIGYMCSDSTSGKCALFFKGAPDSGKSVIADFISRLFDRRLISNVPLHRLADRFNVAQLFGRKLNVSGEIKAKALRDITTFKLLTGGDTVQGEFKGKSPFEFKPRAKLLFSGNALPSTSEADSTAAFTNRMVVLLFNASIPKEQQDKQLLDKLLAERDVIFTLAVLAYRDLVERNFVFTQPEDSRRFLQAYGRGQNSVKAFVEECCVAADGARIFNCDLLDAYVDFCKANGLEERPRQQLYDALDALPGVQYKRLRIGHQNRWGRTGVMLAPEWNSGTTLPTS